LELRTGEPVGNTSGVAARDSPRERLFAAAGPTALVVVIATWALLLILGWALVFWPHVPDGFRFDPGTAERDAGFLEAVYLSLVTVTTLGFGDITPEADVPRCGL
jgi:Ion channel